MSREHHQTCEDCGEDIPLIIKYILTEYHSLSNRRRKLFGSTSKAMEQRLNDGGTKCGGNLYKFTTNIDLITKL